MLRQGRAAGIFSIEQSKKAFRKGNVNQREIVGNKMSWSLIMKNISIFLFSAILIAASSTAGADLLRYGTYLTSSHNITVDALKPYFKNVEKASDGALRFQMFTDGTVVSGSSTVKGIQSGIVDMGTIIPTYTPSTTPVEATLTRLPISATNALADSGAINELVLMNCDDCELEWKKLGMKMLAEYASSPYYLLCKDDIPGSGLLKGKRVRATGIWEDWAASMGAVPVNVTAGEIYSGLNQGTVNCTTSPLPYLKTFGLKDVVRYVLDMPLGTYRPAVIMNISQKKWDSLSEAQKSAITDNLPQLVADATWSYMEIQKAVMEDSKSHGIKYVKPSKEMLDQELRFRSESGEKFITIARERGISNPEKLLEKYHEILPKWEELTKNIQSKEEYKKLLEEQIFSNVSY